MYFADALDAVLIFDWTYTLDSCCLLSFYPVSCAW